MIFDTFDDANVTVTCGGQMYPGCPTSGAILVGCSEWQQPRDPVPTLRTTFAPIIPPTQTRNPWSFLYPGSLILFQLDNRELAHQLLVPEGSESFKRCLEFPTKRYVGLVVGSFRGERDSDAQEYLVAFVSKSLPPVPGSSLKPEAFVVPIASPGQECVDGRRPLRPRSFPWTGCYQYTVLGTRIVPTRIYPSAIEYRLNEKDFGDFDTFAFNDRETLASHQHSTPSTPDEKEASLFENMRMSDATIPLPVKVWQALTADGNSECHDPREFVEEALNFRELAWLEPRS